MTILGIGNDLIEIDRIRKIVEKWGPRFIDRTFTINEQRYCSSYADKATHYAARFSAKEAVTKALGCGFGEKIGFLDIEIINDPHGRPEVFFSEKSNQSFDFPKIFLAITHTHLYVSTVAIWTA